MQKWFQIMNIVILIILFIGAPLAVFSLISGVDPQAGIRRNSEFASLSPYHFTLQLVIWIAMALLAWAFWLNANAFTIEIERQNEAAEQRDADAIAERPPAPVELNQSPLDRTITHYEEQGYERIRGFLGTDDVNLLLFAKDARTSDGLYRREGAIIYPSGDSAKINAGVLHDSDSWEFNSEYKVQRARMGKAVRIKTALNRPHIESLVDRSHHILTIGLASRETQKSDLARDSYLSRVRGYNLGYALWELGWKPTERIYPLFLGPAQNIPADKSLETMQRSVVIVGVNATVEVLSSDAVTAAALLVDSNVVDLNSYSFSETPRRAGPITPDGGALNTDEVKRRVEELSARFGDSQPNSSGWAPIVLPPLDKND